MLLHNVVVNYFYSIQVEVYLDVKEYHYILTNPQKSYSVVHYIPFQQYSTDHPPDIFIAWRYWISFGLFQSKQGNNNNNNNKNKKTKKILWLHDLLEFNQISLEAMNYVRLI